jgi:UDP-N-acetylglucosamine acyltransferase
MIGAGAGIHPSAAVDTRARIGSGVSIGPFCVIGAEVEIGDGCSIGPHVVIEGPTTLGRDNRIHAFAAIGGEPQDKKYRDQPTRLEIGNGNTIREFVTINRGTAEDNGITRIGDDNWIMAYVHIAHDCVVGSHTIFANAASLAGHCRVDDYAILGGFSLIHQFCQVGAHAFTAMGSVVNRDVPPFVTVAGSYAEPRGINAEGLKRRGYDSKRVMAIKRAYKTLYTAGLPLAEARQQLAEAARETADIQQMIDFIDRSQRSLLR